MGAKEYDHRKVRIKFHFVKKVFVIPKNEQFIPDEYREVYIKKMRKV